MTFPKLLLELFENQVDGRVHVALGILGKEVRPAHAQSHRALELPFRRFGVVVLQGYPGINDPMVKMFQLQDVTLDVLFNGVANADVVG
jgi:hypothetical protein